MPRIFDNIETALLPAVQQTVSLSNRADFSVGYFHLRGWKKNDGLIEQWGGGAGNQCRLLIGMQRLPEEELRELLGMVKRDGSLDNQTALRPIKRFPEEFWEQLGYGAPTDNDEAGLRRLGGQLKARKIAVKLYLRPPAHAKLDLCFRTDPINPIVGYVGSSNLTLSGLAHRGELNLNVMDHDAGLKITKKSEHHWKDRWCLDISAQLMDILEQSGALEELPKKERPGSNLGNGKGPNRTGRCEKSNKIIAQGNPRRCAKVPRLAGRAPCSRRIKDVIHADRTGVLESFPNHELHFSPICRPT